MTKLCPFRKANPFDPTDGSWYWVTDTSYGGSFTEATGNGSTDDRSAIQSCTNAAAAAGKNVYFPAATYYMDDFYITNFSFAPQASNADFFAEMWDCDAGAVIFDDGSMVNCHGTALSNTPIGAIVRSGQPPIYRNVSINGSIYNYGE